MPLEDDSRYSCTDIATLKGLGPSYIKSFNNKGIKTLFDILFDFPFKYLDKKGSNNKNLLIIWFI